MKDRNRRSALSQILLLCLFLLVFGLIFSNFRLFSTEDYRPRLVSKWNIPVMEVIGGENSVPPSISARETVIFPDEAMIFLKYTPSSALFTKDDINCIYFSMNSSRTQAYLELSPTSLETGYENYQIVRCPLHPRGTIVSLAVKRHGVLKPGPTYRWDSLVFKAVIDNKDNSTVVFVKGLNLRSGRPDDPSKYKCLFTSYLTESTPVYVSEVVSVAQEIVRCRTPLPVLAAPKDSVKVSISISGRRSPNSIARLKFDRRLDPKHRHKMCVCTMLRNQARFLKEWIMYHSRIGIDRWFIYDNNSNDELELEIKSLQSSNYNLTRHLWPWVKTQEAGFAHCALRARDSCEWIGFLDVDEFFHIPSSLSINDVVSKQSNDVGEIRIHCHSFGPSGRKKAPPEGVVAGYICRLAMPERHKSIVRPDALNLSMINVVHHFDLKSGFLSVNANASDVVINHYKYQVWEVFKEKFYRRVAAYVSDWRQERNVGSKDRAPGLGTEAVEPADWSNRFCEVRDTRLRDRVIEIFADVGTGLLPWDWERRQMDERGKNQWARVPL